MKSSEALNPSDTNSDQNLNINDGGSIIYIEGRLSEMF